VSRGTFSITGIEIIKRVNIFAELQAKVSHILRPGKASEKTSKGKIPERLAQKTNFTLFRGRFCDSSSFIASPVLLKRRQNPDVPFLRMQLGG
jgi:hypothetical protein